MKKQGKISITLENCESIEFYTKNITYHLEGIGVGYIEGIGEYPVVSSVGLLIPYEAKIAKSCICGDKGLEEEMDITKIFKRLHKTPDITHIQIDNIRYSVAWGDGDYINKYQESRLLPGGLAIAISRDKVFRKDTLTM